MPDLFIPKKPCLYCRLSWAPDGSLEKVERQEADGRSMGSRLGWSDFCCVYVDNSRSAWQRNRKRPGWDSMLLTLEPRAEHRHDGIMTYHGDRLIRQPWDLELLLGIADTQHIPLASVSGVRDLSSPDDRFILRIEAAQACRESDNISRRTKRGNAAKAVKGLSGQGGKRPFGWGAPTGRTRIRRDPETGELVERPVFDNDAPRPDEIDYIRKMKDRLLAGTSMSGLIRWLHSNDVYTTQGGEWRATIIWRLLLSPRVIGKIEKDDVLHNAVWDAAITEEEQEALRAIYNRNRDLQPRPGPARVRLLTGVAECGKCGNKRISSKPMAGKARREAAERAARKRAETAQPVLMSVDADDSLSSGATDENGRVRVYYCPECKGFVRNMAMTDAYVQGYVLALLKDHRLIDEMATLDEASGSAGLGQKVAALQRRKAAVQAQLEDLADDPDVDPVLAMRSIASFDRKINELRNQLALSADQRLLARMVGISKKAWLAEPVDVRATVIRTLLRVQIMPTKKRGRGFDKDAIVMTRRPLAQPDVEKEQPVG